MSEKKKASTVKDPSAKFYTRSPKSNYEKFPPQKFGKGSKLSDIEKGEFAFPEDQGRDGLILFSDGTRFNRAKNRIDFGDFSEELKVLEKQQKQIDKQNKN